MWQGPAALLVGFCLQGALAGYSEKQYFTTNAICLRKHCINPIFPALEDLGRLSESPWFCSSVFKARPHMSFCKNAVNYDPAFPQAEGAAQQTMEEIVQRQDGEAAKMFMYHLSGMGKEAWDYSEPENSDDDCVKSVWRMVCFTYFPRAPLGCQDGMQTPYTRPCRSSCQNYVKSCGVQCCDESVQCVFTHTKELSPTQFFTTSGYVPHDGPSTLCTGAASRAASPSSALGVLLLLPLLWSDGLAGLRLPLKAAAARAPRLLQLGALALVPLLLQGCNVDVPSHTVGKWRAQPDYLIGFQFVPPGASARDGVLNSCDVENLALPLQCSGRGVCKPLDKENIHSPTSFCECDRDWADPECKTRRKSQVGAFLLSLFLGFFGVDHFYMGFQISGIVKLVTLGGGGLWWVYDFIGIGSAPIAAKRFRLAADLPHWVFVIVVVLFGMVVGFVGAYITVKTRIVNMRKDALLHQEQEEAYHPAPEKKHPRRRPEKPELRIGEPGMQLKFRGNAAENAYPTYGTMQEPVPSADPGQIISGSTRLPARAPSPAPRVITSAERAYPVPTAAPRIETFGSSFNAQSATDSTAVFAAANQGRAVESMTMPPAATFERSGVPTLGPMEPLASDAAFRESAVGPRVDVGSQGLPAAGPPAFTPSSISGLGPLPSPGLRTTS